jgi:hypothetical protein
VKKLAPLIVAAGVAALALGALADASTHKVIAVGTTLTAAQEIPKQVVANTKATGGFSGTINGSKLTWKLTFSGLTGPATAAHIHLGAMGKAGNVVVPLCTPCKSPMKGSSTLSKALLADLAKHKLYVNVHTAKNPNGEIRGQLAVK